MSLSDAVEKALEYWWHGPGDPRKGLVRRELLSIAQFLNDCTGFRAIDLGSGKGLMVKLLSEMGFTVVAVDKCRDLGIEAQLAGATELIVGDVLMPGPLWGGVGKFDVVTAIGLLPDMYGVTAIGRLWLTIKALLRHDGVYVVDVANFGSLYAKWHRFRGFDDRCERYSPGAIAFELYRYGLPITYMDGVGVLPPMSLFPRFRGQLVPRIVSDVMDKAFSNRLHWCNVVMFGGERGRRPRVSEGEALG